MTLSGRTHPHRRWSACALAVIALASLGAEECTPDDYVAPWPQDPTALVGPWNEGPAAGPLRLKADEHDAWHPAHHQPYYGGRVAVHFTDTTYTEVERYGGWGDSTFFSGIYLGSQAMRYAVTGAPEAKANAIKVAQALSGHLHVTGAPGYIARYRAPQSSIVYEGDAWCAENERCFRVDEGPYAGDFWWGSTSRDQYIGWFFGMTMAYDLIDDEPLRDMIRADMREVMNMIVDNNWTIIAQDGNPTGTAPGVLPATQLSFSLQAYHVTGDERFLVEVKKRARDSYRTTLVLATIGSDFNRYDQYFGNNLAHLQFFQALRLARVYLSEEDHAWLQQHFNDSIHTYTRLSHNAWFNSVYMSQGGWVDPVTSRDAYRLQLEQDLTDFRGAPNTRYHLDARDPATYELDPVSVQFAALQEQFPFLEEVFGVSFDEQALEAFPVPMQCSDHFLWERNPFRIDACAWDDDREVAPGADYLIAYWTSAYHGILKKGR